ncbi:MAG: preprotein translocase subunit YajC [Magnetococcales bacterium]|nr:preprotein translocase subunit YajC [Magnetococcales bacterium]
MFDIVQQAYAQGGADQGAPVVANLLFFAVLFAILYFLMIRPQQKQVKAHKEMITNLQRGDSVVASGGLLGRIHRIEDNLVILDVGEIEVSPKNFKPVRIRVQRNTIGAVTAKAGTVNEEKQDSAE